MFARYLPIVLLFSLAGPALAQDAVATPSLETESQGGILVADLEQQLMAGLNIRREEEKKFVNAVISLVEAKRIPVSLVKSVFHWSRRKNPKVPYPYFERAMRLTAEKINVVIVVPPTLIFHVDGLLCADAIPK